MARILSAIPKVKRRAIEKTARLGDDKPGPSGNAHKWRNARYARYARQHAPKTSRSSNRPSLPREYFFKSIAIDRGCPRLQRKSNSGTDSTSEGADGVKQRANTKTTQFYLLTKVNSSNQQRQAPSKIRDNTKKGQKQAEPR